VVDDVTSRTSDSWADLPVGQALASLRKQAGLTGTGLARIVGMSQSKISRIENGSTTVNPQDVATLARALGAPDDVVRRLVARARRAPTQQTGWRMEPDDISRRQSEIAEIEAATRVIRSFSALVVHGLLQTSEYARGVLAGVHSVFSADMVTPAAEAVSVSAAARIARQQALADRGKEFRLVLPESVFWNRFCEPEDMLAQIRRVREVGQQDNVRIGIIPIDARWPVPVGHDFTVHDESSVVLDLPISNIMSRVAEDIAVYRRIFDLLEAEATTDIDETLDRHAARYYELAGARYN